jgi:hypothetical protein
MPSDTIERIVICCWIEWRVLKRVNLIVPENIHVNSFVYEPILDMGDGELK